MLVYLAVALEDYSPREIAIGSQESPSITWVKIDFNNTFLSLRVFFAYKYEHNFTEHQVVTRKKVKEARCEQKGNF